MNLEQSFEVDAPLERVWQALVDVERVAPALPGAAVTGRNEDGTYGGTFTVKIGPTTASYAGKLEMEEIDEPAHRAVMQANGSDKRGQGGAKATIVSTLERAEGGGTKVNVSTDYHITGRLARFGRGGMIEDISAKLLREFAGRLQAELAGDGAPAAQAEEGSPAPGAAAAQAEEGSPAPGAAAAQAEGGSPAPGADGDAPAAEADAPVVEAQVGEGEAVEPESAAPPAPAEPPGRPEPPKAQAPAPRPAPPPAEPLHAGSLVGSVLRDRVKRNPLQLAFLAGLLFAIAVLRRRQR